MRTILSSRGAHTLRKASLSNIWHPPDMDRDGLYAVWREIIRSALDFFDHIGVMREAASALSHDDKREAPLPKQRGPRHTKTEWTGAGGSELAGDGIEGPTQAGTDRRGAGNDGNRDQRGNEAVFDGRRTRFIVPQMRQKSNHGSPP